MNIFNVNYMKTPKNFSQIFRMGCFWEQKKSFGILVDCIQRLLVWVVIQETQLMKKFALEQQGMLRLLKLFTINKAL